MNKHKFILLIIYTILLATVMIFGFQWFQAEVLLNEAIKQGAENTVTALQMTSACMVLGNFTQEDITRATIEMFLFDEVREHE